MSKVETTVEEKVVELEEQEAAVEEKVVELEEQEAAVEEKAVELEEQQAAVEEKAVELEEQQAAVEEKAVELEELDELNADMYLAAPKVDGRSLEDYRKLKEEGVIFQQSFSTIDRQNTLYAFAENGIRIKMTSKNIDGFYHGNKNFSKVEAINKTYNVVVMDVVEEEKLVYVSANAANADAREKMRKLLDAGIEHSKYKVVKARVIGISTDKSHMAGREICLLNLGGLGIMGTIRLGNWSRCFTPSFHTVVKEGDIIKVAVIDTVNWTRAKDPVYVCSRKLLLPENPWKDLEKKIHVRDLVRVTCTDRGDKNFFGKIEGLEELNAYCFYPEDPDYVIEVGKTYVGKICRVSEETRELKVRFPNNIKE